MLLAADGDARLRVVDVQHDACGGRHARAEMVGERSQRLDVGGGGDEIYHRLPRPTSLAQRHEAQQPASAAIGHRLVSAEPARPNRARASTTRTFRRSPGSPPRTKITYPFTRPTPSPPKARSSIARLMASPRWGFVITAGNIRAGTRRVNLPRVATAPARGV